MTLRSTCARPVLPILLAVAVAGCATDGGDAAGGAGEEAADLVLRNGTILTLAGDGADGDPVTALAARDGRLIVVGDEAAVEAFIGDATEVIDLAGRTAIPGFIEGHAHFLGVGDARLILDLRPQASWQEIVDTVAAAVAEAEPGEWIRGRGWHQDKWSKAPDPAVEGLPVHDALSAMSPENPVLLTHASGHALIANAKAMELAGIDASTADPPGGEILHDADGAPTGFFRETAMGLVHAARTDGSSGAAAEERRRVELASAECLEKGITSFHDAGSSFREVEALRAAAADGALGIRLWVMIRDGLSELERDLAEARVTGEWLTVGGIKLSIDGALGSRGAWLLEPYSDSPESTGLNLVPVADARRVAELALEHGYQLGIHAIGDRANREVLDLYERVFTDHPEATDRRWRIEHAQHLHPDDVPRFAELGVTAAVQGVHCTSDGPWVPDRLGEERSAAGAYVWRDLIRSGAVLVNGTDAPVEDVDPIANFYASVSRRLADGSVFYPDQRMTRLEALESYTENAAWAVFEEADKGTLEVGKLADVTVLSQNLLEVPEDQIPATEVVYTIVDGKVAYRAHGT